VLTDAGVLGVQLFEVLLALRWGVDGADGRCVRPTNTDGRDVLRRFGIEAPGTWGS
jgi:hypothetical protein